MSEKKDKVYTVEKDGVQTLFGSIAAIFDVFTAKDIGVSCSRLYQVKINEYNPYKNKKCSITLKYINRKVRS